MALNALKERSVAERILRGGAVLAACAGMAWMGVVVHRPYAIAGRMEAENRLLAEHNHQLELENQRLAHRIRQLQTDAGMEREARKLGYVRKGEQPLIIPSEP
ncbi:MAG: FtsB family cell division protein [Chthonomonadales bacterium]